MLASEQGGFLEKIATAPGRVAEGPRRGASGAAEGANEIGDVVETDVECDVRNGQFTLDEQPGCVSQSRAHEILMRRHAHDGCEHAQKVIAAQTADSGRGRQIDIVPGVRIDP